MTNHAQEAEKLLEPLRALTAKDAAFDLDLAQVHATLAMVDTNRIAHVCHEANRALQVTSPDHNGDVSPHFMEAPEWMVQSAIAGVDEALQGDTPEQLHAAWCDHKTADGWVYGTSKDANKKTHPCLVPYKDLPADQRIKDRVFLAIVHAFKEES